MNKAEVGSVQFFRRMITMITVVIIAILLVALILVSVNLKKAKADLNYYQNESSIGAVKADTGIQDGETFPYQTMYPDLYVDAASEYTQLFDADRFFYLTFTGGPSKETEAILDQLKIKGVKATFFVYGGDNAEGRAIMQRIVNEGHSIGVYGYEAQLDKVYDSVESYLDDFWHEYRVIYDATGVKPTIFKFEGGTTNRYNALIRQQLCSEMVRRGFTYYDWNANSGDMLAGADKESIVMNSLETSTEKQRIFLQMHDTVANHATAAALPEIIDHYKDAGYTFAAITNDIQPMAFE